MSELERITITIPSHAEGDRRRKGRCIPPKVHLRKTNSESRSRIGSKKMTNEIIHNSFTSPIHKNHVHLTGFQQRIVERMLTIHENDDRAVSYLDFGDISHDVIRHEFSQLRRMGVIERATTKRTTPAWYKVKGASIHWDSFTLRGMVGKGVRITQPIQDILDSTPYGPQKMHNIRFRFYNKHLHSKLLTDNIGKHDASNNTVFLGPYTYDIYREYSLHCYPTGYNTVIIGCSTAPIRLDSPDIMTIPSILSQLHGRLLALDNSITLPTWDLWTMTYYEVGQDSVIEFTGERFQIRANDILGAIYQYYAKEWSDGKVRIRMEKQDAPNKPAIDALIDYQVQFTKASDVIKKYG